MEPSMSPAYLWRNLESRLDESTGLFPNRNVYHYRAKKIDLVDNNKSNKESVANKPKSQAAIYFPAGIMDTTDLFW